MWLITLPFTYKSIILHLHRRINTKPTSRLHDAGIFPFNTSVITLSGNMTSHLDTIGIDYDIWLQR